MWNWRAVTIAWKPQEDGEFGNPSNGHSPARVAASVSWRSKTPPRTVFYFFTTFGCDNYILNVADSMTLWSEIVTVRARSAAAPSLVNEYHITDYWP